MTQTAPQPDVDETEEAPKRRFLQPPSACGTEFEQVEWAGVLDIRLGGTTHAGVRFSDRALMDAVLARLGDRATIAPEDVPPYYSVKVNAPTRRRKAPLHYVYLGARPVVGTRDPVRLLEGLAAHLGQHLETVTDAYTCHAVPVRTPSGLLLAPGDLRMMGKVVDRVLRPEGFVLSEAPSVQVDLDGGEVVIPEPGLSLDLDPAAVDLPAGEPEERLSPGRYRIDGWLVPVGAEEAGPLRHAAAVLHVARSLKTPFPHGAQRAVDDVARLTKDLPVSGVAWTSDEELVQAVLTAGRAQEPVA